MTDTYAASVSSSAGRKTYTNVLENFRTTTPPSEAQGNGLPKAAVSPPDSDATSQAYVISGQFSDFSNSDREQLDRLVERGLINREEVSSAISGLLKLTQRGIFSREQKAAEIQVSAPQLINPATGRELTFEDLTDPVRQFRQTTAGNPTLEQRFAAIVRLQAELAAIRPVTDASGGIPLGDTPFFVGGDDVGFHAPGEGEIASIEKLLATGFRSDSFAETLLIQARKNFDALLTRNRDIVRRRKAPDGPASEET